MRFFADPESVVLGLNEEAYVEVAVGRLAAKGRNPVHVDVEDGVVERPHVESGFFACFPQRDREGIGVSVAVTTGLQPASELAVVRQKHAVARHVHDPRRAGDVADPAGTVETVGMRVDERIEACDGRRLLRPSPAVCGEERFQSAAVHGTKRRGTALALMCIIGHTRWVHNPERPHEGNTRVLSATVSSTRHRDACGLAGGQLARAPLVGEPAWLGHVLDASDMSACRGVGVAVKPRRELSVAIVCGHRLKRDARSDRQRSLPAARQSLGDFPVILRNSRLKFDRVLKPLDNMAVVTDSPARRPAQALSIRKPLT